MTKKHIGFTMSEALITLGIIGIVAAITIPSLMNKYRAIVLAAQFKEQHSRLAQALKSLVSEEEISLTPSIHKENFSSLLAKHYKISHDCGRINIGTKGCIQLNADGIVDHYKTFTGAPVNFGYLDDGMLVLLDGTTLFFEQGSQAVTLGYYIIGIDINGYKNKPNRFGHDLFAFKVEEDGQLIPTKNIKTWNPYGACNRNNLTDTTNGLGCAFYAIQDSGYFKNLPK